MLAAVVIVFLVYSAEKTEELNLASHKVRSERKRLRSTRNATARMGRAKEMLTKGQARGKLMKNGCT